MVTGALISQHSQKIIRNKNLSGRKCVLTRILQLKVGCSNFGPSRESAVHPTLDDFFYFSYEIIYNISSVSHCIRYSPITCLSPLILISFTHPAHNIQHRKMNHMPNIDIDKFVYGMTKMSKCNKNAIIEGPTRTL